MPSRIVRCRLPCELTHEGTRRGFVVNLSERGLFVQTGVSYAVDTVIGVRILPSPDHDELVVAARVARVKKVHPGAQAVVARGMGLEVIDPPAAWQALTTRLGCRTADEREPPATGDPTFGLPSFLVVLRRKDGIRIRTRVVNVACLDAEQARAGVEADVEDGWEIVKVEWRETTGAPTGLRHFRVVAVREGGYRRWETRFDAVNAEEARRAALSDLGGAWRIEAVEPAAAALADDAVPLPAASLGADADPPPASGPRPFQLKMRHQAGLRVRTRVAKVQASSEKEAIQRVVAHLGEGWQAVKVTPL